MEFRVSEFKFEIDVNINVGSTLWSFFFLGTRIMTLSQTKFSNSL